MTTSEWCHAALAAGCLVVACGIALPVMPIVSLLVFATGATVVAGYVLVRLAWPGDGEPEETDECDV